MEQLAGIALLFDAPFDIAGRVVIPEPDLYTISDLQVTLGSSTIGGTVEVSLAGPRPQLRAALSAPQLDFRSEVSQPQSSLKASQAAEAQGQRVFPSSPLPLSALQQTDGVVTLQVERLFLPQLALNSVSVDMRLQDGRLSAQPLTAGMGGGTLQASLDVLPQNNAAQVVAKLKADQVDIGRMLQELQVSDAIKGTIDGDIALQGHGNSVAGLMATLNGSISVMMGEGQIDNHDVDLLGSDISASVLRLLNPFRQEAYDTAIHCFVSRFDLEDPAPCASDFPRRSARGPPTDTTICPSAGAGHEKCVWNSYPRHSRTGDPRRSLQHPPAARPGLKR